jgi:hypothetical protein
MLPMVRAVLATFPLLFLIAVLGCSGGGGGGGGGPRGEDPGPPPQSFQGRWSGTFADAATGKRHGFLLEIAEKSPPDAAGARMLSGTIRPLGLDGVVQAEVAGARQGARADLQSQPGPWNLSFFFVAETALAEGGFRFEQTFGARQLLEGALRARMLAGNERVLGTWIGTWRSSVRAPSQGTMEWIVTAQSADPGDPARDLVSGRLRVEGFPEISPVVFGLQGSGAVEHDVVTGVETLFPRHVLRLEGGVHLGLLEGRYQLRHVDPDVLLDRGVFQADLRP